MTDRSDGLDRPVSIVVGATSPMVRETLRELASRGHDTASIGPASTGPASTGGAEVGGVVVEVDLDHAESVEAGFVEACGDRALDILVYADVPSGAARSQALVDMDEGDWDLRCESVVRRTLLVFQAAHRRMAAGGSIVLVVPSISLTGAAGLAAWSAGAEAQRILAKVAARRWGSGGIRVNVVSVPPTSLSDDTDGAGATERTKASPALDEAASSPAAAADLVCLLVGVDARSLTGSTLVADGGSLMVP